MWEPGELRHTVYQVETQFEGNRRSSHDAGKQSRKTWMLTHSRRQSVFSFGHVLMSLSLTIRCENRCSPVPDKVKRGEKQKQKKTKKKGESENMGERERNGKDRKKSRNRQRCRITWNSSGTRRGKKRQLRLRGVQRTPVRDRRWAMQALAVEIIGKEAVQPQKGCRTASLPSNLLHQTLRDLKREKATKKNTENVA